MPKSLSGQGLNKKGRNVAIEYEAGMPRITKDGVTIVKNIATSSNLTNIGIDLIKRVSHSANELCGDGTTTAAILTAAILQHGNYYLKSGVNPILMKRGIVKGMKVVEQFLEEIKVTFNYKEEREKLRKVAMVATNYDELLADIISEAVHRVGPHGQIFVEPSNVYLSGLTVIEGGSIAKGFASTAFLTKEALSVVEFSDPLVLLLNFELDEMEFTAKILDFAKANPQHPLVIFCPIIEDKCLSQVLFQRTKSDMQICVVEVSFKGDYQNDILEDFAALFNAKVIDQIDRHSIDELSMDYFGTIIRES